MIRRIALALAAVATGTLAAAAPLSAGPGVGSDIRFLVDHDVVEVRLDTAGFAAGRVAAIRITNRQPFVVRGFIAACRSVFTPADPAYSAIRPAESGPFIVGPKATVTIVRPFRLVDPSRRPPGAVAYVLDDAADAEPGCRD